MTTTRSRILGATAASLLALGAFAGAATAQAAPAGPQLTITDPWGGGEIPLDFGAAVGSGCQVDENDPAASRESVMLSINDARPTLPGDVGSLDIRPYFVTLDVAWDNADANTSGKGTSTGIGYNAEYLLRPGAGHVTGTMKAAVSGIPGVSAASSGGLLSSTIEVPFDVTIPECPAAVQQ